MSLTSPIVGILKTRKNKKNAFGVRVEARFSVLYMY
jgi:hypothetical protein